MGCSGSVSQVKRFMRQNYEKDKDAIQNLLIETKIDTTPNLNKDYCLTLDPSNLNHKEFMQKCSKYKFPNIKYLEFAGMQQHNTEVSQDFETFFKSSLPYGVDYLVLRNKVKKDGSTDLKKTFEYLKLAFDAAICEVYIDGFDIDNFALASIFENCSTCGRIVLLNWNIKIDGGFKLDFKKVYSIETLDLYGSYYPQSVDYLNKKGLEELAGSLQKSSMFASLRHIHITSYMIEGVESKGTDEQKIFTDKKFHLTVTADKNWPKSSGTDKDAHVKEW